MLKITPQEARTAEVIASKLKAAMAFSPMIKPAVIARACGVTPQGVSGWTRTGRIDKRHIPVLASLTGTALEWWMDGRADSPPVAEDRSSPPARAHVVQEELPFYGSAMVSRLVKAFAELSQADREHYLAEIEAAAARTQALYAELKLRDSPAAAAFGPAVSDHEVERKMNLKHHPEHR